LHSDSYGIREERIFDSIEEMAMENESDLQQAIDEFNQEMEHARHDLWVWGYEVDNDGFLVYVDTPWAMGAEEVAIE